MPALPTRPLGTTGMNITRVGFGAWAAGGSGYAFGWAGQDDAAAVEAIRRAVARGINWIDTAPVYGLGHSERIVATALRDIPVNERPYVFTKCGMIWRDGGPDDVPSRVATPETLRRELDASLQRLGVERIDLYQVHWPPDNGAAVDEYWETLAAFKQEGKVRAIGLSNHNVAQLERAEAITHVDTLQPPFSAARRDFAATELPWCVAHNTGVLVYAPMQSGLLTGTFTAARAEALPADDWRSRSPRFQGDQLQRSLALADALGPIARRHGVLAGVVAVAWTLAWPGVTGAIVGARSAEQVDGWIAAASLALTSVELGEIAAAIERTGAGQGPVSPARAL